MHSTSIDLAETTRKQLMDLLNARLADISDLASHTKMAHWNVKGPSFIALHELFDELYAELGEFIDELGERITALGGTVYGTVRMAAGRSTLDEYPDTITDGPEHVRALAKGYAAFGGAVREVIDQTDEWGDMATSDLFTEIVRAIDKRLWFLEAHLQAER